MTDTDILAFLKARLDEDEAHARKDLWALDRATPGTWQASYGYNLPYSLLTDGNDREIARFVSSDPHAADALLVGRLVRSARARAERVLREVAAKRAMLAAVEKYRDPHPGQPCEKLDGPYGPCELHFAATGRLDPYVLVLLAAVWSDHPDYNPSWTVE